MKSAEDGAKTDMNVVISGVLKYGVLFSTSLVAAGVAILFLKTPQALPGTVVQLVATGFGKPTLDLSQLLGGLAEGNPVFIIQLGLIILLATPIARVVASVVLFAAEKDRLYVGITLIVLAVLIISLVVVGPIEAAA